MAVGLFLSLQIKITRGVALIPWSVEGISTFRVQNIREKQPVNLFADTHLLLIVFLIDGSTHGLRLDLFEARVLSFIGRFLGTATL